MCICDPGYTQCGNRCVYLPSDQNNCGACGHVCDSSTGYTCVNSNCICGYGTFGLCPGADGGPDVCSDLTSDPHHCSFCGNDCGALMCANGSCTCNSPLYECTADGIAYCADISHDIDNCGKCGGICGPPTDSHDVRAIAWQCVSTAGGAGICACNIGFFPCANSATMTDCVDLSSDLYNCGYCNNVCDGGETCTNSSCRDCKSLGKTCFTDAECCAPLHCDQNSNLCKT